MSFLEQKKKQFIRWYYGEFVNDPQAETFTFGLHRPLGAIRVSRNIARVKHVLKRIGL